MAPPTAKICGITTISDALAALDAGADWIGLNLVAGPRRIDVERVEAIATALPDPRRIVVLVSVGNESSEAAPSGIIDAELLARLKSLGITKLQLYHCGDAGHISSLQGDGFDVLMVHPVSDEDSVTSLDALLIACESNPPAYLLFDTADASKLGGTGRVSNWDAITEARDQRRKYPWPPVILAGGLTPENVAQAIRFVRPFGVDVSSGVEIEPGRKDVAKMERFVAAAKCAID